MAATPRCHTDDDDDDKKVHLPRKCCLLTAMVSKACLIGADENIFQVFVKFLGAENTDTTIYLEWLFFSLSGNTKPV